MSHFSIKTSNITFDMIRQGYFLTWDFFFIIYYW
nr:MAG TPA: hypothetical protein [Caudoviricetes sp.]